MTAPTGFTPYQWQIEAARRLATAKRLACAAAPGAGKTAAALLAADEINARRVLVIAPAGTVAQQWATAAEAWGRKARVCGGPGEEADKMQAAALRTLMGGGVAVLPWSRLSRAADAEYLPMLADHHDLLIIDESHKAQGCEDVVCGRALWGKPCARNGKRTRTPGIWSPHAACLLLTGTPTTSDPKKLRAQFMGCGLHLSRRDLATRYRYEEVYWGGRKEYNYGARREIWVTETSPVPAHAELVRTCILRVSAEELAQQMPAHSREVLDLLPGGGRGLPAAAAEALHAWGASLAGSRGVSLPELADLAELRAYELGKRLPALSAWVGDWHEAADPDRLLLIWCQYQAAVEAIAEALPAELRPVTGQLHGGLPDARRWQTLDEARAGRLRVLVATTGSTGTGVDGLQTHANESLIAQAPWTPGEVEQTEGRLVRTGQTRPVRTIWMAGGIEGIIATALLAKAESIETTLAPACTSGGARDEITAYVEGLDL